MVTRTTLILNSNPAIRNTQSFICKNISAGSIQNYYPLYCLPGETLETLTHDEGFCNIPAGFNHTNGMNKNTFINNC
jgi:hypothetical protein